MRTTRRFVFGMVGRGAIAAADTDFAVVASRGGAGSDLSMADLRKLFLGDRQFWSSNLRVALVMRAPVARERAIVVWTILQNVRGAIRQYWIGKVMRADCTTSPRQFSLEPSGDGAGARCPERSRLSTQRRWRMD